MLKRLEPWQRNQYALLITVAAAHLGFDFSGPFLPLYVRKELGVTDVGEAAFWSGLLVGISPLCAALLGPFWGSIADRYGRKRMVLRALFSISIMSFVLAAVPNVIWAFWARLVMGFFAGFTSMTMALAVTVAPRERVGSMVGMMQAAQFLPLAIGPPIAGLVSDRFGLRANFALSGVMVAVAGLMLIFLFQEPERPGASSGPTRPARQRGSWREVIRLPGFLPILLVLFLANFAERSLSPIIPLYLAEIQTPPEVLATITGLVISAGAVAAATSATIYGRLARPGRTRIWIVTALAGGALFVGPIVLASEWHQVLALRLGHGLLAGGAVGLGYTLGARLAPPERAGLAMGVLTSVAMLGGSISPFLAGLLGRIDLRAVFLADSALYVVALVVAFLLLRTADRGPAASPSS